MSTTIEKSAVEQSTPVSKLELLKRKIAEQKEKYSEKFLSDDEFALEIADMVKGNMALSNKQEQEGGRLEKPQRAIERAIRNKKAVIQNDISSLNNTLMECQNAITEAEAMETSDEAIQEEIKNAITGLQEEKKAIEEKINNLNQDIIKLDDDQNQEFSKLDSYKIDQAKAVDDPYQFAVETAVATRNNLKESLGDKDSNTIRMPDFKNEDKEVYLSSIKEKAKEINEEKFFIKKVEDHLKGAGSYNINGENRNNWKITEIINAIEKSEDTDLPENKKRDIVARLIVDYSEEGQSIKKENHSNNEKNRFLALLKSYPEKYEKLQEKINEAKELTEVLKNNILSLGDEEQMNNSLKILDTNLKRLEDFPKEYGTYVDKSLVVAVKTDSFSDNSLLYSDTRKPNTDRISTWLVSGFPGWEKTADVYCLQLKAMDDDLLNKKEQLQAHANKAQIIASSANKIYKEQENKKFSYIQEENMRDFKSSGSIHQAERITKESNDKLAEKNEVLQARAKALIDYLSAKEEYEKIINSPEHNKVRNEKQSFDERRKKCIEDNKQAFNSLMQFSSNDNFEIVWNKLQSSKKTDDERDAAYNEYLRLTKELKSAEDNLSSKKSEKNKVDLESKKLGKKLSGLFGGGNKVDYEKEVSELEKLKNDISTELDQAKQKYNKSEEKRYLPKNPYNGEYSVFAQKGMGERMSVSAYLDKVKEITDEELAKEFPADKQQLVEVREKLQAKLKEAEEKYNKAFNVEK